MTPCKSDALYNYTIAQECIGIILNFDIIVDCNQLYQDCIYDACHCQNNKLDLCYMTIWNNFNDTCSIASSLPTFSPTYIPTGVQVTCQPIHIQLNPHQIRLSE